MDEYTRRKSHNAAMLLEARLAAEDEVREARAELRRASRAEDARATEALRQAELAQRKEGRERTRQAKQESKQAKEAVRQAGIAARKASRPDAAWKALLRSINKEMLRAADMPEYFEALVRLTTKLETISHEYPNLINAVFARTANNLPAGYHWSNWVGPKSHARLLTLGMRAVSTRQTTCDTLSHHTEE